jgi:hypothetical protein
MVSILHSLVRRVPASATEVNCFYKRIGMRRPHGRLHQLVGMVGLALLTLADPWREAGAAERLQELRVAQIGNPGGVNKQELVDQLFLGIGAFPMTGANHSILPETDPHRVGYPYDPKKARQLLDEARAAGSRSARSRSMAPMTAIPSIKRWAKRWPDTGRR